jgi:hyperosmotically inducible periplasmic protein
VTTPKQWTRSWLPTLTVVSLLGAMVAGFVWLSGVGLALAAVSGHEAGRASDSAVADALTHVRLRADLLEKLGWDALAIDVDVHGSSVVLSGRVHKRSTEELSEEVALSVPGVKKVDDDVEVIKDDNGTRPVARGVEHAEREVGDALLEARVKGRLLEEIGREAFRVEVEATDGVVSLRGTVPSREQREIALRTARRTTGVVKVIDLIRERA